MQPDPRKAIEQTLQAKIGKLTADREKLTRIIKRGTATLELQQASSLREITGIASLIWKSCIPETQELCAAYALQGQYLSIVSLSAIAIIVSSCSIVARGLIALLLKRPSLSPQNPQT